MFKTTNYKLQTTNYLILALFLFLIPSFSSAEKVTITREGLVPHNISLLAEFEKETKKDIYKPADSLRIDVRLNNQGKYCLLDGTLIYSLVAGGSVPKLPPNSSESDINSENVINELTLPVTSCPNQSVSLPVTVNLPEDLRAGDYRIDFYLKSPRAPINGNHETYRSGVYLPFKVSGSGDFPQAKIVRSKTRFAGAGHQIGPVVVLDSEQSSFVTVVNEDIKNPFNGKLVTSVCAFGEQSGLGCEDVGSRDVKLPPGASEIFENSIDINFSPDVYSVYYRLIDDTGLTLSNYKNRFIIRGHKASVRGLALDKRAYAMGDRVNVQASINGPYTFGESEFTANDIDFKVELFDRSGIFEKRVFSKNKNFPTITSNSEVGFYEFLIAESNITGYRLCGTLSSGYKVLNKRCTLAGQDNTILPWPTFDILITGLILFVSLVLWRKLARLHKKLIVSHIILLLSFLVSTTIILYSKEDIIWAGVADQFQSTIPGDDRFVNPAVTELEKCSYINFYYDKNGDNQAQASEKINLYRGRDDGLYYVPKNTIAYLFRPVFDDPDATIIYNGKPHVLPLGSPFMDCVDPIYGYSCANGDGVGAAYFPVYLMDVVRSLPGEAPTFTSTTTHDINVTAQQLLDAINANTYSDSIMTIHTTISPALTLADIPDLAALNSGGNLNLFDSYFGMTQVQPPPYEEAKILTNYKTRCEFYNPQANASPNSARFNLAINKGDMAKLLATTDIAIDSPPNLSADSIDSGATSIFDSILSFILNSKYK